MKEIAVAAVAIAGVYLALRLAWACLFGGIRDDISDGPPAGRGGQ